MVVLIILSLDYGDAYCYFSMKTSELSIIILVHLVQYKLIKDPETDGGVQASK